MKLVIYNGSPRGKGSNSTILTEHFLKGYSEINSDEISVHYLNKISKRDEQIEDFKNADTVIIIFPLYSDAMPGAVKEFIECIHGLKDSAEKNLGFIVQSGFPEAVHSYTVEKYLRKFTIRMGYNYLGTVIKGGVEGIQVMPPYMTKKLFNNFIDLGKYFADNAAFSPEIMKKLRESYKMSATRIAAFKVMMKTGLADFYWNKKLKEHNAFEKRFDQPYKKQ